MSVRVYSPTVARPAFPPTGELVDVPALALPGGRGEYRLARGLPRRVRRDLAEFAPNLVHVAAPEILGHRAVSWARTRGTPVVASLHTRFEAYPSYYRMGFLAPLMIVLLTRFYNRVDRVMVPGTSIAELIAGWGVRTPVGIWSRGVDHDRFNPKARSLAWRRSLGIADDEVAIGFLGRLVLEKGLDIFADLIVDGVTGALVPARDVAAYAEAIARYAQDDALRLAAGAAGNARADTYQWSIANQAVLDAYLAVAG